MLVELNSKYAIAKSSKLEKLPEYFRDTMDWFIGFTISNTHRTATGQRLYRGHNSMDTGGPRGSFPSGDSWNNCGAGPSTAIDFGSTSTLTECSFHSANNFSCSRSHQHHHHKRKATAASATSSTRSATLHGLGRQQPLKSMVSARPSAEICSATTASGNSDVPSSSASIASKKCFVSRGVKSVLVDISSCLVSVFRSVYRHNRCRSATADSDDCFGIDMENSSTEVPEGRVKHRRTEQCCHSKADGGNGDGYFESSSSLDEPNLSFETAADLAAEQRCAASCTGPVRPRILPWNAPGENNALHRQKYTFGGGKAASNSVSGSSSGEDRHYQLRDQLPLCAAGDTSASGLGFSNINYLLGSPASDETYPSTPSSISHHHNPFACAGGGRSKNGYNVLPSSRPMAKQRTSMRNLLRGSVKRTVPSSSQTISCSVSNNCGFALRNSRRSRRPKGGGDGKENLASASGASAVPARLMLGEAGAVAKSSPGPNGSRSSGSSNSSATSLHKSKSLDFSVCDTVSDSDLMFLVMLPPGLDLNEWLASHTMAFFHHINLLYGCISELCTVDSCPVMQGPGNVQYPWVDDKGKKCKCTAPQYIDYVMSFTGKTVTSEDCFPTKYGHSFSSNFDSLVRKLLRLLYHVLGHLINSHWHQLLQLGLSSQSSAVVVHFKAFVSQFSLLDAKDIAGLTELAQPLRRTLLNSTGVLHIANASSAVSATVVLENNSSASSSNNILRPSAPEDITTTTNNKAQQQPFMFSGNNSNNNGGSNNLLHLDRGGLVAVDCGLPPPHPLTHSQYKQQQQPHAEDENCENVPFYGQLHPQGEVVLQQPQLSMALPFDGSAIVVTASTSVEHNQEQHCITTSTTNDDARFTPQDDCNEELMTEEL